MYIQTKRHHCFFWGLLSLYALITFSTQVYANKSGVEPGVLSLPSGPGSLGGVGENVQANLNMGLMSYQIKVKIPQGRGMATPDPSITYSSSAGSGIVGIGWDFSAGSSIERATVRGLPTYTNEDLFYAGGEIVKIPGGPFYRARYEGGFMRYRWVQKDANDQRGYWIAEAPDGTKMYYGANAKGESNLDAQVYGLKGTFRWELVTTVDRNGNRIEYSYFKEGAQTYPDQIAWVFDANNKPLYHLKFGYEDRPDFVSDGKPGFDLQTTKRLKEVQITSNDKRFRSYHFDFEDSTGLSRLIKVTRYGSDPKIAHPVQFSMKYSDAVFSPDNSRMVTMPTALGVDFRTNNIDFIDINGDGLPDVVDTSKAKHLFFMNQLTLTADLKQDKHDFPSSQMRQNPTETSAPLSNPSVQMLDYNGDGFTDLVDAVNKKIYINKGNSQWENSSASLQNFPVTGTDPNMRFFDYNGDKAIDVISSDGSNTTYWVSDGKGNWKVTPGTTNIGLGFANDKLKLIDINGDGLQDIVHITKNSMRYRKYLGYGNWTDWIDVKVPGIDQYELSTQAQFNDINGDGMADMVAFLGNSIVYFVNKNGTEFSAGQKLQTFKGVDLPDSTKTTVRIVDINGNGSRDIVYIDSSGKVVYVELFGKRPNLMTEISNGIGQRINVEYGSSVYFSLRDGVCDKSKDAACSGPWQNKMPMPFNVVTKISTWASRENDPLAQKLPTAAERAQIQNIYYHDGFYDGNEKKFRGFRKVESIQVGDDSIADLHQALTFDVGDKDAYFYGKLLHRSSSDNKGHIYNQATFTWTECPLMGIPTTLDPPVRFICQTTQEESIQEGTKEQARWKTLRNEQIYDGYGNITESRRLGVKDVKGDEQIIKRTFINPKDPNSIDSPWFLNLVQKIEYCNQTDPSCAETRFYYDGEAFKGLPAGQVSKANLTRVEVRKGAAEDQWINVARRKFDPYGNILETLTARGLSRTSEWDEVYHIFAIKETVHLRESLKFEATASWDYALNAVTRSTDFNGHITSYTYDTFGRISSMSKPDDPTDKPSMVYTYEIQAPLSRIITQRRSIRGGELDTKNIQCFDGLGRKLATLHQTQAGSFSAVDQTGFNARGLSYRNWLPYRSDGKCAFVAPADARETVNQFDGLGRMVKRTFSDGSITRTVYEPLKVTFYDEEDNRQGSPHFDTPKVSLLDGLGRVLELHLMDRPGHAIITKFGYTNIDKAGRDLLHTVTFPNGKQKVHTFDLMGRITKLTDPDRNVIEYTYDDDDNLLVRKDADGVRTVMTYDLIGRLMSRQQENKPETQITYAYDTAPKTLSSATNLKTRLAQITFPAGSYAYSYDERGNLAELVYQWDGLPFKFTRKYDNAERLLEETFPDGRKLTFQWDMAGNLTSIPGHIEKIEYAEDGLMKYWQAANGIKTAYTFDSRQRPKQIDVGGGKALRLDYTLDASGNILTLTQAHDATNHTNTYTYDALYRLTQASLEGGKEALTYGYDDLHNLVSKTSNLAEQSPVHIGKYNYDPKQIHALKQAGPRTLGYDIAGRTTLDGTRKYTWDYLHRRTEVREADQVIGRDIYGPDPRRLVKEENGVHTFYISDHYEIRDGKAIIYVRLGHNKVVAWSAPAGVRQLLQDLAPATGDAKLTPQPDAMLTAADAWLHHAGRKKLLPIEVHQGPLALDLTKDVLQASLTRMLDGDKETKHTYHADHLGSIRAVTDEKGQVVIRKNYYPYGYLRTPASSLYAPGFMGTEHDALTRTNRFYTRALDPQLGRWQSPDPIFEKITALDDEFNSYGMVRANPLRYRDIDGNDSDDTMTKALFWAGAAFAITTILYNSVKNSKSYFKHPRMKGTNTQAIRGIGSIMKISSAAMIVIGGVTGEYSGTSNTKAKLIAIGLTTATSIAGLAAGLMKRDYKTKAGRYSPGQKKEFRYGVASNAMKLVAAAVTTAGVLNDDPKTQVAGFAIGVVATLLSSAKTIQSTPRKVAGLQRKIQAHGGGFGGAMNLVGTSIKNFFTGGDKSSKSKIRSGKKFRRVR